MRAGSEAVSALPFVLAEPEASAVISQVGDSNIVLLFFGWIDQRETNFGKARSMAIRAAMRALEAGGFTMPEPIYRLRFDGTSPIDNAVTVSEERVSDGNNREPTKRPMAEADESLDVRPDNHLAEIVEEELREQQANDLLDNRTPRE
jgi:hypothetical protein